jgi:hypothetical protein
MRKFLIIMTHLVPDQKVVCIKRGAWTNAGRFGGEQFPVFGKTYTVREVDTFDGAAWITLCEIVNPLHPYQGEGWPLSEASFRADRFRPIVERTTDISTFTKMLTPEKVSA